MKVCLVRPPAFVDSSTYPYNLECVNAAIKFAGHETSFLDADQMADKIISTHFNGKLYLEKFLNRIFIHRKVARTGSLIDELFSEQYNPLWDSVAQRIISLDTDLVAFSCYSASMSSTEKIINTLREKKRFKKPIILGGIHPSSCPEEVLSKMKHVNFIVIGEGEATFVELLNVLSTSGLPATVKGICYRDNDVIKISPPRPLISDLDTLPTTSFDFIAEGSYAHYVILTSRGCPFHCNFCASKVIFEKKVRFRSADSVVSEIQTLIKKTNLKLLRFGDDTFTVNKAHIQGIADELQKRGITDISFSIGSRIDTMDAEKLKILKSMGVTKISFGIETGSKRMMESINKNINTDDVVNTIKMVNDAGINTTAFFIINHPGEKTDDMSDTLKLVKDLNKHCPRNECDINTGFPYPKTQWWDYAKKHSLLDQIDFYRHSHRYNHQHTPLINMTDESTETLMEYWNKIHSKVKRHNMLVRGGKFAKIMLSDPERAIKKLFNLFH